VESRAKGLTRSDVAYRVIGSVSVRRRLRLRRLRRIRRRRRTPFTDDYILYIILQLRCPTRSLALTHYYIQYVSPSPLSISSSTLSALGRYRGLICSGSVVTFKLNCEKKTATHCAEKRALSHVHNSNIIHSVPSRGRSVQRGH